MLFSGFDRNGVEAVINQTLQAFRASTMAYHVKPVRTRALNHPCYLGFAFPRRFERRDDDAEVI
jgi:hypothetical protein